MFCFIYYTSALIVKCFTSLAIVRFKVMGLASFSITELKVIHFGPFFLYYCIKILYFTHLLYISIQKEHFMFCNMNAFKEKCFLLVSSTETLKKNLKWTLVICNWYLSATNFFLLHKKHLCTCLWMCLII